MSVKRSNLAEAWLPEDFGDMLNLVVASKSVAAKVSKNETTDRASKSYPLFVANPAVGWYDELDEIAPNDPSTSEVVVTPFKTAGLTLLSNESVADSDPSIAENTAAAIADQIAKAIDTAYFGNTTAKSFNGLLSLASTAVDPGAALTNLDPFIAARFAAEAHRANLTHWVMKPETAEVISKLKTATGSNQSLLAFVEDGITIAGLPVITSVDVDAATTAWGIDKSQQRYVVRKGTTVERFPSVTNDGTWVRGIARVGAGFLNPAGVVRIYHAA